MEFQHAAAVLDLRARIEAFMAEYVYPNEDRYFAETAELGPWKVQPVVEELKTRAKAAGLWNLFLPDSDLGAGLSNTRLRAALRGDGTLAPRTGGVQLLRPGYRQHGGAGRATAPRSRRSAGCEPLLAGEIRSSFAMTETGGRLLRRHEHRKLRSAATVTSTSSTAASGTPPAPPTRAARS
ncbi:MAG: hypothetical protein ACMVO3_07690 [Thalassobaculum sp.]